MQVLLYYPGCSIKRDFPEVEKASLAVLAALGYKVVELRDWYCCGGFPGTLAWDHIKYVSALRTLSMAYQQARELSASTIVTLCAFCYNTLKQASQLHEGSLEMYKRVADYLRDEFEPYRGGLRVAHFIEILYERVKEVAKLAEGRLKKIKVAAYYGCVLLRPKAVAVDNPDNPRIIEEVIKALGAEPVTYPYRTYCCGSFQILAEPSIVKRNVEKIAASIAGSGAEIVVTPCQLCLYNLRKYSNLKILDLSELVAYAMNLQESLSPEVLRAVRTFESKT